MVHSSSAILLRDCAPGPGRPRRPLIISIALHVVLLALLLRGRSAVFVAPASVRGGVTRSSVTPLYWPTASDGAGATGTPHSLKSSQARLTFQKWGGRELAFAHQPVVGEPSASAKAGVGGASGPAAGSVYGSLLEGPSAGSEIRPALPVVTSEPVVSPEDLRGIVEGNVVIEITIDQAGNIVSKIVVASMGPAIDARVLAALENWHFRPATRDDVPIPSKQDVVYHFKPR
jgi:TonB family protein